jgi:hypothetical protein
VLKLTISVGIVMLMIDDFVRRPPSNKAPDSPDITPKTPAEDFLPDLSKQPATPSEKPDFVTPSEAASKDDEVIDMSSGGKFFEEAGQQPRSPKAHWWTRLASWFGARSKFQKAAIVLALFVVLGGSGAGVFAMTRPAAPVAVKVKPAPKVVAEAKPATVPSTLSGLPVDPSVNERPATAVMVENSTDARPQSGLQEAGVVFEAIAEGGITRFMAVYQDTAPDSVGPVRSARPYYLDWALGFDAGYAHVGGSPEALQDIKTWGVRDLDQFANSKYYQRVTSKFAPHNVYTSIAQLNQLEAAKGYSKSSFTGFARKADSPAQKIAAKNVTVNISSPLYNSKYNYDPATNSYLRIMAGAPHVDEKTKKQIAPKVVVAMVIPYSIQKDGKHSTYGTVGSGQALVFQDGQVTTGTWKKAAQKEQITFTDASGQPLKLNAGQTWVVAVNAANKVSYTP